MALKGQSIRNGVIITLNGEKADKAEVIALSQDWSESQEKFFKKMLQQGGRCKVNGNVFEISERNSKITFLNSSGICFFDDICLIL